MRVTKKINIKNTKVHNLVSHKKLCCPSPNKTTTPRLQFYRRDCTISILQRIIVYPLVRNIIYVAHYTFRLTFIELSAQFTASPVTDPSFRKKSINNELDHLV